MHLGPEVRPTALEREIPANPLEVAHREEVQGILRLDGGLGQVVLPLRLVQMTT